MSAQLTEAIRVSLLLHNGLLSEALTVVDPTGPKNSFTQATRFWAVVFSARSAKPLRISSIAWPPVMTECR